MSSYQETFVIQLRSAINDLLDIHDYDINHLCQRLSISRSHLHRQVKEATGMSVSIYVREIRVNRATNMLLRSDDSIAEIGYRAGFKSAQNFTKYFSGRHGVSPRKFRLSQPRAADDNEMDAPGQAATVAQISLAVLPFVNASSDKEQDYFVDGLTEEIQYRLSQSKGLKVAGRASTFYFKSTQLTLSKIATQLNVDFLVVGTVRKYQETLRIGVELIKVSQGDVLWTEIFENSRAAIFDIQETIVAEVQSHLQPKSESSSAEPFSSKQKTHSVLAYELYLKGRGEFALRQDLGQALHYYHEAVKVDSNFAHAYYGIAFTKIYGCIFSGYRPIDMLPQIEQAYKKAASLNSNTAEFYIIEGWIKFYFYNQFDEAIASMQKAVEIDADAVDAYRIWGYFHCFRGQYEQAIPLAQKAYELDPLGFNAWFSHADILRRARKYDSSLALFVPLKQKFPNHNLIDEITGLCYVQSDQIGKAGEIFKPTPDYPVNIALWTIGRYMFAHSQGQVAVLQQLLDHLLSIRSKQWIQPTILALINYHLGQHEVADGLMDEAVAEMDFGLKHIHSEPYWDEFRDRAKVKEVLEKIEFEL